MPELRYARERSADMVRSIQAELPALEAGCRGFASPSRRPVLLARRFDAFPRASSMIPAGSTNGEGRAWPGLRSDRG
jgi:hypothetical protein